MAEDPRREGKKRKDDGQGGDEDESDEREIELSNT